MIGEEAIEVDLVRATFSLREADSLYQSFCLLVLYLAKVVRVMYTAEVDKIERSSAEHEKCLKIKCIGCGGDIVNHSALIGELELRDAAQLIVNSRGVSEQVGIVFYATAQAIFLLRYFRLNGKYLKHFYFLSIIQLLVFQISDLLRCEVTPFSHLERAEADISYSYAAEARYSQILCLAHLAYLAITPLVKRHFKRA